ncbi:hypothetical protein BMJ22_00625, partial [Sinorhizobium medicae]
NDKNIAMLTGKRRTLAQAVIEGRYRGKRRGNDIGETKQWTDEIFSCSAHCPASFPEVLDMFRTSASNGAKDGTESTGLRKNIINV